MYLVIHDSVLYSVRLSCGFGIITLKQINNAPKEANINEIRQPVCTFSLRAFRIKKYFGIIGRMLQISPENVINKHYF